MAWDLTECEINSIRDRTTRIAYIAYFVNSARCPHEFGRKITQNGKNPNLYDREPKHISNRKLGFNNGITRLARVTTDT